MVGCLHGHGFEQIRVRARRIKRKDGTILETFRTDCNRCHQERRLRLHRARGQTMQCWQINRAEKFCPEGHEYRGQNILVAHHRWFSKRRGKWMVSKVRICKMCRKDRQLDDKARRMMTP